MKKIVQFGYVVAFSLLSVRANAQLDSGNVFLRATFAEVGIAPLGWFGSSCAAPAGFHADFIAGKLGFVADPDIDGWSVGTPPFFGDYFLPGTPFEGWELQVDTSKALAYNLGESSVAGLSGSNISYTSVGSVNTGVWQGTFNGITINQTTSIDTNSMYFLLQITLTNMDTVAHNNIYYIRTLDPDNDEMQPGGGFPTDNYVVYNRPTDSVSLAAATGVTYRRAYLGLGSADTNSRALVYDTWPLSSATDLSTVYDETCSTIGMTYYTPGDSAINMDIAIGLIFNIGHLAPVDSAVDSVYRTTSTGRHPANSASFSFFYSFTPAASDSALKATGHHTPVAIANVNAPQVINVYPNPAKNTLNITGLLSTDKVQLLDMMGKVVKDNWNIANNFQSTYKIDDLQAGQYILIVSDEQGSVKSRIHVEKI